jgi:hypothetical protein
MEKITIKIYISLYHNVNITIKRIVSPIIINIINIRHIILKKITF